jgi:hypothetical protein
MRFILLCMLLTGCTALTKTEELVSAGVAEYCKAPELNRTLLRTRVSEALKPNSIKINCAN